jgi:hypothetical protein
MWLYDLVDPDDQVRSHALARQRAYVAAAWRARTWSNRVWAQAGSPAPTQPPNLGAEWDQSEAEFHWHERRSFTGPIAAFLTMEPDTDSASFALLYLRWETCYPHDWRVPELNLWSPWSTKEHLLRRFGSIGVPGTLRPAAADLLLTAIRRPYRCKDWQYVRLVDHVCDAAFRARIVELADELDPLVTARARFVLHVADHPCLPLNRHSWRRWLLNNPARSE